ncbi:MAG: phenylacetate--CoA ligase family protein, partial [Gammaproteobacteria bacterium]
VNLFPTAIRSILNEFSQEVGETFQIRPRARGVAQDPPLPIVVELGKGIKSEPAGLSNRVKAEIRSKLLVSTHISFVPYGTLPRETYKYKLVDYSDAISAVN